MTRNTRIAVVFAALLTGVPAIATAQAPVETLPGGASSLRETFGDWIVACAQREDGRHCAMSQHQADAKTKQRILAIEMRVADKNATRGNLVLPFGLALDAGITLQIDSNAPGPKLGFVTCLPGGCVVPLAADETMTAAMRRGAKMAVAATSFQNRQPVAFAVSLTGFSAALDRLRALAK